MHAVMVWESHLQQKKQALQGIIPQLEQRIHISPQAIPADVTSSAQISAAHQVPNLHPASSARMLSTSPQPGTASAVTPAGLNLLSELSAVEDKRKLDKANRDSKAEAPVKKPRSQKEPQS